MEQRDANAATDSSIPSGWILAVFDDICDPASDGGRKIPQKSYLKSARYPVVDQGEHLIGGFTDDESLLFQGETPVIVFGDHTRRFKLIDWPFVVGADGVKLIRPTSAWIAKCLWYFLCALKFEDRGYSRHFQFLRKSTLPLPPLPEQSRIADALDELLSALDAGVAALERVREKLSLYRASILKAAVEGALTAEWRAQHPHTEPASELLKRILLERRRRWEEDQLARFKAKGQDPPKNWKAKYKVPAASDTTYLPSLPEGWFWATVAQLAAPEKYAITDGPFGSELKTEHYTTIGPRVIRLQNVKDGSFADERAHISEERFALLEKHRAFSGDLIIAALGDNPPRACVVPDSIGPAIVKADCIRFKPNTSLLPHCLNYFLNAIPTRLRTRELVHGIGRPRMNLDEIRSIVLPIPPRAEQETIVEAVEDQLSVIDHLESDLEAKLKSAFALRQSILRHAFAGQLVPQDPNDEPASELLKRIAAERKECARESVAQKRETKPSNGPKTGRRGRPKKTAKGND